MKTLILSLKNLKKTIMPLLLTVALLFVAMHLIITLHGNYCYASQNRDMLRSSGLNKEDIYFMTMQFDGDFDLYDNTDQKIKSLIETSSFADLVLYWHFIDNCNGYFGNVYIFNDLMTKYFAYEVSEGRWLNPMSDRTEAVILGDYYENINIGDTIRLENGKAEAVVVGKLYGEIPFPMFNSSTNRDIGANALFETIDYGIFVTENILDEMNNEIVLNNCINFYVDIDNEAKKEDREKLIDNLKSYGKVSETADIIKHSDEEIKDWIKNSLPFPVFLIVVCTINIISICAIIVKKTMFHNAIYYLCGCTRSRSIFYICLPLGLTFSFPLVLNILSIYFFPHFLRSERLAAVEYTFSWITALIPILFMVFILFVIVLIPIVLYSYYSPLDFYRRQI